MRGKNRIGSQPAKLFFWGGMFSVNGLPFAVDQAFLWQEVLLIGHLAAFLDPVAKIKVRQVETCAPVK